MIFINNSFFSCQRNFFGEASDPSSDVEDLEAHPDDATTLVLGGGEDVAVLADVDDQQEDSETLGLCFHFFQRSHSWDFSFCQHLIQVFLVFFWTYIFSNLRSNANENQLPSDFEAPGSEPSQDGVPTDKCLSYWFSLKMFLFIHSKVVICLSIHGIFSFPTLNMIVRCASVAGDSGEDASTGGGVSNSASGGEESDSDPCSWIIAILRFVYVANFTCPQEDSKEIVFQLLLWGWPWFYPMSIQRRQWRWEPQSFQIEEVVQWSFLAQHG